MQVTSSVATLDARQRRILHDPVLPMLLRMAAIFRIVAEVLAQGVAQGNFRPIDPLLTHVSLVGSLMFLIASQPIRDRLVQFAGLPPARHSPADLARHIGNLFLHGLETAPARPKPATRPRPARRRS